MIIGKTIGTIAIVTKWCSASPSMKNPFFLILTIFEVMNVENSFQAHFRMWSADEEFKGDLQARHKYRQIWGAVGGRDSAHPGTGVYKGGGGQYTGQSGQYTEMVIVATRHCPATECRWVQSWVEGRWTLDYRDLPLSPPTTAGPHQLCQSLTDRLQLSSFVSLIVRWQCV